MNQDLEKRIEERRLEAVEKNIHAKAQSIAQFLGWCEKEYYDNEMGEMNTYHFSNNKFKIRYMGGLVSIIYDYNLVYKGTSDKKGISSYVPGDWEKDFEEIYHESEKAKQNKIKEAVKAVARKTEEGEKELKIRFGLE